MHDRIFGFGSVSMIFSGFGGYSVSAEYLKDLTETEHLHFFIKYHCLISYSSVPNKRADPNKRAGWNFLELLINVKGGTFAK